MQKSCLIVVILINLQAFAQTNGFHLQNNNTLIELDSKAIRTSYWQFTKTADSVIFQRKKVAIMHIETFLDSLHKAGYQDKAPTNLSKKSVFALQILSHQFLRIDTIYSKPDSIFITTLQVSVSNAKHKVNQTWQYNLYSNLNVDKLNESIKYCNNHYLYYFSKCKIYSCAIDVSIFTWLIGKYETFQSGENYNYQYFK